MSGEGTDDWPLYKELPVIPETGVHHNWGVFGADDEFGTLNFLSAEGARAAARLAREGVTIDLSLPLDLPDPPLSGRRQGYSRHVDKMRTGRDDKLDGFYLQGSTQWDGLQHIRYREFGYYGGREEADLDNGALGIDRVANRGGIVGRGVLLDVAGWATETGVRLAPDERHGITPDEFEAVLEWEGCQTRPGDVLLVRTAWVAWYLALPQAERAALSGRLHNREGGLECPGLDPAADTAAWLWDHRIAAVAVDNPAVETLRVRREEGFLHRLLIPLLGMQLGEFWNLEELATHCRDRGQYDFLFVSVPLKVPGGVGSPGNGVAVM
jgi:kynurenine formamidase